MTKLEIRRWRGLAALARDAVLGTSHAVERVHLETARRPFGVLRGIPLVAAPAAVAHGIHDVTVLSVHGLIRLTARAVDAMAGAVLDAAGRAAGERDHRS